MVLLIELVNTISKISTRTFESYISQVMLSLGKEKKQ